MDHFVRKSVREWCYLAKDNMTSTFHARLESDGYGILCLSLKVCIGRRNHIKKLQKNMKMGTDPVLERLVSYSPTIKKETGKFQVIHYHDCTVYSKNDIDRVSTIILYSTVDRAGLKHCSQVCSMHRWVKDVTRLLSSRNYVGALQLRSKCLYSSWASRGRVAWERNCDLCGVYESLSECKEEFCRNA